MEVASCGGAERGGADRKINNSHSKKAAPPTYRPGKMNEWLTCPRLAHNSAGSTSPATYADSRQFVNLRSCVCSRVGPTETWLSVLQHQILPPKPNLPRDLMVISTTHL